MRCANAFFIFILILIPPTVQVRPDCYALARSGRVQRAAGLGSNVQRAKMTTLEAVYDLCDYTHKKYDFSFH